MEKAKAGEFCFVDTKDNNDQLIDGAVYVSSIGEAGAIVFSPDGKAHEIAVIFLGVSGEEAKSFWVGAADVFSREHRLRINNIERIRKQST